MRLAFWFVLASLALAVPAEAGTATFRCALGVDMRVTYSADQEKVTVQVRGQTFVLDVIDSDEGRYSDGNAVFVENQGEAQFVMPGLTLSGCKLVGPL